MIMMNSDIVIEILARLPAKSLVRFMAVCRLWKSIITSPQFRLVSKRPSKLLVHTNRECYSLVEDEEENLVLMFETDFPLRHYLYESAVLMGSDNGLLCIGIHISCEKVYYCVIIWNPCIRKHVVIPDQPIDMDGRFLRCSYGFGATISGLDYKLVCLVSFHVTLSDDDDDWTSRKAFNIYSLKTGTWRRKYLDFDLYICRSFSLTPALLRGRLHWIIFDCSSTNFNFISSFELEDEVFEDNRNNSIMLPQHLSVASELFIMQDVTVIKESLLAVIAQEIRGGHCTIWVMEEYGDVNSWSKMCNIDLTMSNLGMRVQVNTFRLLKNGEELLLGLSGPWHPRKLVTYNPTTMRTNDLLSSSELLYGFTSYYKESLVLLADDHRAVADHKVLSSFNPSIQVGYYPGGGVVGFQLYHNNNNNNNNNAPVFPMFLDQYGYYYVWTGFHWLQLINYNPQ